MSLAIGSGRPRKPEALKKLEGTFRADRANANAPPAAAVKLPRPPADLTEREAAAWRLLAKLVDPLKVATRADVVSFRQMAVTLAIVDQAREELHAEQKLTYEVVTEAGLSIRKRPELEIILQFKKQLSIELSRWGLTPADREKVTSDTGGGKEDDPLSEFATGGGGAA